LQQLTERQRDNGRSYAGFNPAREEEARLFAAVLAGDHIARGFRNREIRDSLYTEHAEAAERRTQATAVGRLLKRLHVRAIITKVPHTRRWRLTENGRRILSDTLQTYRRYQTQTA
jgi:hypothetical protein